jgi:hypothetical protein
MAKLSEIKDSADLTAKRLDLDIEQISAFGDGVYRVEFKERPKEPRKMGFGEV